MTLKDNLKSMGSEDLKRIYRNQDTTEWPEEAFSIISRILEKRGEKIPDQKPLRKLGTAPKDNKGNVWAKIFGSLGTVSFIIGIGFCVFSWQDYSSLVFFESGLLMVNIGFVAMGFSVLMQIVGKGISKQNKIFSRLLDREQSGTEK